MEAKKSSKPVQRKDNNQDIREPVEVLYSEDDPVDLSEAQSFEPPVDALDTIKEGEANFYVSLDGVRIAETMQPILGFYSMPTVAFYGPDFPQGELKLIVRANSSHVLLSQFPKRVLRALSHGQTTMRPFEFFWVISDISSIIPLRGLTPNMVYHAWRFPESTGQRSSAVLFSGIFTSPDKPCESHVFRVPKGLPVNGLIQHRVIIHPSRGGFQVACSPNNAKFGLSGQLPAVCFWTVALHDEEPRAVVSLQWVLLESRPTLDAALQRSRTLRQLFQELPDAVDDFLIPYAHEAAAVFQYQI